MPCTLPASMTQHNIKVDGSQSWSGRGPITSYRRHHLCSASSRFQQQRDKAITKHMSRSALLQEHRAFTAMPQAHDGCRNHIVACAFAPPIDCSIYLP